MSVIPITLFFSLLLATTFVVLFARDHWRRRFASAERDSLLPLADEKPAPVRSTGWAPVSPPTPIAEVQIGDHLEPDHHHAPDDPCGCRSGLRPPCVGCLRRRAEPAPTQS